MRRSALLGSLVLLSMWGCQPPSLIGTWEADGFGIPNAQVFFTFAAGGKLSVQFSMIPEGTLFPITGTGTGTYRIVNDNIITEVKSLNFMGTEAEMPRRGRRNRLGPSNILNGEIRSTIQWVSPDAFRLIEDRRGTTMTLRRSKPITQPATEPPTDR